MRIINRIVEWTDSGITYEGDQRHVEICMKDLGVDRNSKAVATPIDKTEKLEKEEIQTLDLSTSTRYRGMVARMNFLAQDRSDIQQAVKDLSKEMSKPNQASWIRLKRLVRYLKGAPRYRTHCQYQSKPDQLTTWAGQ